LFAYLHILRTINHPNGGMTITIMDDANWYYSYSCINACTLGMIKTNQNFKFLDKLFSLEIWCLIF